MKNKKILFLQFIIIVLFTSCKESEDNYIIYEKNSCNYFSYLKNISTNKTSVNNLPISEEIFFINMENHAPIEAIINNQNSDACSEVCYDVNLNAIYESLIAKNIIENIELNKKMSLVFQKIFKKIRKVNGEVNFNDSIMKWINTEDSNIVFPSLQRQNITNIQVIVIFLKYKLLNML